MGNKSTILVQQIIFAIKTHKIFYVNILVRVEPHVDNKKYTLAWYFMLYYGN